MSTPRGVHASARQRPGFHPRPRVPQRLLPLAQGVVGGGAMQASKRLRPWPSRQDAHPPQPGASAHRSSEGALLPASACMALDGVGAGACLVRLLHRLRCAGARQQAAGAQRLANPVVQRQWRPATGAQRYRPSAPCQLRAVCARCRSTEESCTIHVRHKATKQRPARGQRGRRKERAGAALSRVAVHGGGRPKVGEQGEHGSCAAGVEPRIARQYQPVATISKQCRKEVDLGRSTRRRSCRRVYTLGIMPTCSPLPGQRGAEQMLACSPCPVRVGAERRPLLQCSDETCKVGVCSALSVRHWRVCGRARVHKRSVCAAVPALRHRAACTSH